MVPVQPRHPIALAQQVLSVQAVCEGRLAIGLGVSHHWIIDEMLGLPYEHPVATMRAYLDVLDEALAGPGPVDVENERFRVHNPLDITDITPTPVLLAALGPRMLQLCGERTDGTILWMADERAIGTYIVPNLTRAAEAAGRPAPRVVAGVPVCLCADHEIDTAVARTNRILSEAEVSPNYQKLLDQGDAQSVGDILVAGSESTIRKRLQAFADAGVTDLSVRVVPIGEGRDELIALVQAHPGAAGRTGRVRSEPGRRSARSRRPDRRRQRGGSGGSCRVASSWRPSSRVRARAVPNSWSSTRHPPDVVVEVVLGGEPDAGQHLLAVTGGGPGTASGQRLGHGRRLRRSVLPGGAERGVGGLDGHQGVGQPVPDGLEVGDGLAELDPLQGVRAGQLEHGPRGADQLVADGQLGQGHGLRPGAGFEAAAAVKGRSSPDTSTRPRRGSIPRTGRRVEVGRGHLHGHHRPPAPATTQAVAAVGQGGGAEAADDQAVPGDPARRTPRPRAGSTMPAVGPAFRPEGGADDGVEGRRRWRWPALLLEQGRHGRRGSAEQRLVPAELVEGAVEGRARGGPAGPAEAPLEQVALVVVHHRSAPRSSRRRAMMFRWISAVPP